MSTVLHLTISTDLWRRKPAKTISSMSRGSGAVAAYVTTGSVPMATAASMRAPPCAFMSRKFSAPFLWMCQCMPVVLLSYFGKLMARLIIGIIVTTLILFCNETYGSFIISRSSSATSSSFSTPRAMAMRS